VTIQHYPQNTVIAYDNAHVTLRNVLVDDSGYGSQIAILVGGQNTQVPMTTSLTPWAPGHRSSSSDPPGSTGTRPSYHIEPATHDRAAGHVQRRSHHALRPGATRQLATASAIPPATSTR
jgi:hypothetical protein